MKDRLRYGVKSKRSGETPRVPVGVVRNTRSAAGPVSEGDQKSGVGSQRSEVRSSELNFMRLRGIMDEWIKKNT